MYNNMYAMYNNMYAMYNNIYTCDVFVSRSSADVVLKLN